MFFFSNYNDLKLYAALVSTDTPRISAEMVMALYAFRWRFYSGCILIY